VRVQQCVRSLELYKYAYLLERPAAGRRALGVERDSFGARVAAVRVTLLLLRIGLRQEDAD
jgi:hypothetical protein